MTGENLGSDVAPRLRWREPPLPQPGGRDAAPGDLALVQSFINSHYDLEFDHGVDLFATPELLAHWLERRRLLARDQPPLTQDDVSRAVAVREGLRGLAAGGGDGRGLAALNDAARGAALEVLFTGSGPAFAPATTADGLDAAIAVVLAVSARGMIDESWTRLKVCPGERCGWAFFDYSRNQSGRWCSMAVCGARAKARAHYRRRRGAGK